MNNSIKETEHISTLEEIKDIFEKLLQGQKYKIVRKISDEKGLYLLDIKVQKKNEYNEYSYMREGRYQEGQASNTAIHVTFFNCSGVPTGGHSVAKFENEKWILIP